MRGLRTRLDKLDGGGGDPIVELFGVSLRSSELDEILRNANGKSLGPPQLREGFKNTREQPDEIG